MTPHQNIFKGGNEGNLVQAQSIDQVILSAPVPMPLSLASLPSQGGFVGRGRDLEELLKTLGPAGSNVGPNTVLLTGSPGVGKTALALRAGRLAMNDGWFNGGVLYFDLRGYSISQPVTIDESVDGMIAALAGSALGTQSAQVGKEALIRAKLAELEDAGKRMLIIADNVATTDHIAVLRPGGSTHRLIVTSRNTLPIAAARIFEVGRLRATESMNLIRYAIQIAHPGDSRLSERRNELGRIVELCDNLPLALAIVAQILASDRGESLAQLAGRLEATRDRLDELEYDDSLAIRAAFDTSYVRLQSRQAKTFRMLSINKGPYNTVGSAAALIDSDEAVSRRILGSLLRAHMLERTPDQRGYQMHDLLQIYSIERCEQEESRSERKLAAVRLLDYLRSRVSAARAFIDPMVAKSRQRSSIFTERKDAYLWLRTEAPNLSGAVELALEYGFHQKAMRIAQAVFQYARQQGWRGWMRMFSLALEATNRCGNSLDKADALEYAGNATQAHGDAAAAQQYFAEAARLLADAGDRPREAYARYCAASAMHELGNLGEAVESYRGALALQSEYGSLHGQIRIHAALARAYTGLGRTTEASAHVLESSRLSQIAAIRPGVGYGPNPQGAAISDVEIRLIKYLRSDHQLALDFRRTFSDQYGDAQTFLNLAEAYGNDRQFEKARHCADQAKRLFTSLDATDELTQVNNIMTVAGDSL